ncbi:MarR family transcriptional regulator [Natronorubrum sp. JWXQ-INN-674]|uniref:MarR family transcriptional regulator n=1 Tax=Natronorubrum halalkaliphilum TaxID=2691917 RepID=A0A6B0VRM2_9EURY|nr:helix-turn-helix domain-containing protein [Natronorubrum halalkaliphilum]MXV63985.1 MarR family transcriptional regulator [Natronorubrum halalkaliphilum]
MSQNAQPRSTVSVPADVESAQAKLVYLYLSVYPDATPADICGSLEMTKGAVLSITGTLRERGHIERTDSGFELA